MYYFKFLFLSFFNDCNSILLILCYSCVCWYTHANMYVQVRGQLACVNSLLPVCGLRGGTEEVLVEGAIACRVIPQALLIQLFYKYNCVLSTSPWLSLFIGQRCWQWCSWKPVTFLLFLLIWGFSFFPLDQIGLANCQRKEDCAWAEGGELCSIETIRSSKPSVLKGSFPCRQGTDHLMGHGGGALLVPDKSFSRVYLLETSFLATV